ncbi:hypothetical protein LX97_02539 [Nonlabens dokdonensis]|uniref:Uncharacterized protein n=2 Tax=Nonlabens dokdonensis TaxID=328515 RepID=L7WAJ0_NONDD|nr:hypothetical protein [Nonlabens dokdonensis]AGC78700.1 hypothetical protein DDD_3573 [Nonlabens dokdonensis DSW-6]PZX39173.1 hypothetical protein LX97_02539 [Nonlabens dokdonensis]
MKEFLLLLIIIPLLSVTSVNAQDQFIGKWKGNDGSQIGFIEFDEDGYVTLRIGDQIMGGKEFILKGEKGNATYKIDVDKNPIEVVLIMTKIESGKQKKQFCIAQFINDNEMLFAVDFNNQRPTEFTEENSIILKREL